MDVKINTLTPELFLELYSSVGREPPGMFKMIRSEDAG